MNRKFDMKEFLRIVVPSMLTNRTDYYIKGGLAYDVYFKEKTNSIDFDIVGTSDFVDYITKYLDEYSTSLGLKLEAKPSELDIGKMVQFAFEGYTVDGKDPFFMDVIITDSKLDYTTLCGINYMTIMNFVADLLVTQSNRLEQTSVYCKSLTKDSQIYKETAAFNKKYNTDINIEFSDPFYLLDNTIRFLEYYANIGIFSKKVVDKINNTYIPALNKLKTKKDLSIIDIAELLNTIDLRDELDDEFEDEIEKWDDFIEDYVGILANINVLKNCKIESGPTFTKYKKTRKRYSNVINITWENLSDEFKRYLLVHCDTNGSDLVLFNQSETCKAYVRCLQHHFEIRKKVSGCADETNYTAIDKFLETN